MMAFIIISDKGVENQTKLKSFESEFHLKLLTEINAPHTPTLLGSLGVWEFGGS